jgi:uncharacterized protein YbjT (DUF2867 family)
MKPTAETPKLSPVTPNQILAALKEMVRGRVSVRDVAKALTEATVNFTDFATGSKVYIIAGPGAGYRGTLKEIKQGFATVSGNMGSFWFCPVVFLTKDENPPTGNTNPYGDNAGALAGNASRSGTV